MIALHVTRAAALSIVDQADYYRQQSGSALSGRWESAVDQGVHSLLHSPERGALCRFRSERLAGARWILVPGFPKHIVFYRYLSEARTILIIQVLHSARNLEVVLGNEEETK